MRKFITMTAYRRPRYTEQVLKALSQCHGVGDWVLLPHVEPGCDKVRELIETIGFCKCHPTFNRARLGLNKNAFNALDNAADRAADFVIHMEDDTLPANDFLSYCEWCAEQFEPHKKIFNVAGYNKPDKMPVSRDIYDTQLRDWFTCWGWGTWKDRLNEILKKWSFKNPKSFAWHVNRGIRGKRQEVHPIWSRVQNIGYDMGENGRTHKWYKDNHRTHAFVDSHEEVRPPFEYKRLWDKKK